MEESGSEPVSVRRPESAITIRKTDLEDLIGQVVQREMAGQQVGPSSNPPREGKSLGVGVDSPPAQPSPGWGERASLPSCPAARLLRMAGRGVCLVPTG